jgi:hypothetical protein
MQVWVRNWRVLAVQRDAPGQWIVAEATIAMTSVSRTSIGVHTERVFPRFRGVEINNIQPFNGLLLFKTD